MDRDNLSPREEALLAEARREAAARKSAPPAPAVVPAEPQRAAKPAPTAAERLAQLMEDERAETQKRKEKMRRYGLTASGAILGVFLLWVLLSLRRRR